MATAFLLQHGSDRPTPVRHTEKRPTSEDDEDRVLVCASCLQVVTGTGARIEMSGRHAHTFTNPHGLVFHIGCFAVAPGCRTVSDTSTLHTWFPGYAWQVSVCRGCGAHLGWLFRSGDSRFHGLILDRLAETESSSH